MHPQIIPSPIAPFARLLATVAVRREDVPRGVALDLIAGVVLEQLFGDRTIPTVDQLAERLGEPAAPDGAAAGFALLRAVGIETPDPDVAVELVQRVIVPSVVVDEIVGTPRKLREDCAADVEALNGWIAAVARRCNVSADIAEDRLIMHFEDALGNWWTPADEAAA